MEIFGHSSLLTVLIQTQIFHLAAEHPNSLCQCVSAPIHARHEKEEMYFFAFHVLVSMSHTWKQLRQLFLMDRII